MRIKVNPILNSLPNIIRIVWWTVRRKTNLNWELKCFSLVMAGHKNL